MNKKGCIIFIGIFSLLFNKVEASEIINNKTNYAKFRGEWKGSVIIDAYVLNINVYMTVNAADKIMATIDVPQQKEFNLPLTLKIEGDKFYASKKSKQGGFLTEFIGKLKGNTIIGEYKIDASYFRERPGVFVIMKSDLPVIKNEAFPPFDLELIDESTRITNQTFKGKYLLVDLWATWCAPCMPKRPILEKISKKYKKKLEILSISLDPLISRINSFRENKFPMSWNHAIKPNRYRDPYVKSIVPKGIPFTYLINPEGKVVAVDIELQANNLEETIQRLLEED